VSAQRSGKRIALTGEDLSIYGRTWAPRSLKMIALHLSSPILRFLIMHFLSVTSL
jgi:hypothetical protein